jgi:hypothetical protein
MSNVIKLSAVARKPSRVTVLNLIKESSTFFQAEKLGTKLIAIPTWASTRTGKFYWNKPKLVNC